MGLDLLADFTAELEGRINSCAHHPAEIPLARTLDEVHEQFGWFEKCRPDARQRHMRERAKKDLFFLGRYVLGWWYADHPWQFERAREVQADPYGVINLWSRGHMKTHWNTYALTIQEILNDPEVTVCIFSHTRPIAKAFLRFIKQTFENNDLLKDLFPDILWRKPDVEAPKWSEDEGICVKRRQVSLEQTVEAWGLLDGQPTSKHFGRRRYDDVVTLENVTSSDMIAKTTNAWEMSLNLALPETLDTYCGTFYHENDTYHEMIRRGTVKVRRYPIFYEEDDDKGHKIGQPVFFSVEQAEQRKRDMGPRNFALQCLLDPKQDTTKLRWRVEWLQRYTHKINTGVNVYILVDPANEQTKKSDYTTMGAIGLGADHNYYLLALVRDRLNLKQRTDELFRLHQMFTAMGPGMIPKAVGYEKYGKDSDIQHIEEKMSEQNYHFMITPLAGRLSKRDRINRLQPLFEAHRWYLPMSIQTVDYEGNHVELISSFIQDEYTHWPDPKHDDVLDMLARILDPKLLAMFPVGNFVGSRRDYPEHHPQPKSWMSAW